MTLINEQKLITLGVYSLETILPRIGFGKKSIMFDTMYGDVSVKVNSVRMECFRRNQKCIICQLVANRFLLQSFGKLNGTHLNLYFVEDFDTKKVLYTRDHWVPRRWGGSNGITNARTMCWDCNQNKKDKFPPSPLG